MPSHKHFEDLCQEEVLFGSSELIMAQILLGPAGLDKLHAVTSVHATCAQKGVHVHEIKCA